MHEQDAKRSVLWDGAVEVIKAQRVRPSAFYSLLCDEVEHEPASNDKGDADPATAPAQNASEQVRRNRVCMDRNSTTY